jgi:hypothetical protein
MLRNGRGFGRRFPRLNAAVGGLSLASFVVISTAFASEFYRCDVLQLMNCD